MDTSLTFILQIDTCSKIHLIKILKWSRDFLLYTKNETSHVVFYDKKINIVFTFNSPVKFMNENTSVIQFISTRTRICILFCDKTHNHFFKQCYVTRVFISAELEIRKSWYLVYDVLYLQLLWFRGSFVTGVSFKTIGIKIMQVTLCCRHHHWHYNEKSLLIEHIERNGRYYHHRSSSSSSSSSSISSIIIIIIIITSSSSSSSSSILSPRDLNLVMCWCP